MSAAKAGGAVVGLENILDIFHALRDTRTIEGAETFGSSIVDMFSAIKLGGGAAVTAVATLGKFAAVMAAIYALYKAAYNFVNAGEIANSKMEDAISSYENAKSQIEATNNELKTTQERMNALQAKGGLTLVEKEELNKLKEANKYLNIEQDLNEKDAIAKAKETASKIQEAVTKNYYNIPTDDGMVAKYKGLLDNYGWKKAGNKYWDKSNLTGQLAYIQHLKELQDEVEYDTEDWSDYQEKIDSTTESLWAAATAMEKNRESLIDLPREALSNDDLALINSLSSAIETIYKQLDPAKWGQMKLDDFFSLDSIQDEKRNLLDLAKDKKYEGISKGDFSDYFKTVASDLQEALGENYLDIIADAINSEAGVVNVDNIKKNLKKDYAQSKFIGNERGFSSWVDNLSNEDTEIVYKLSLNADSANWSLDQWIQKLQEYKQSSEQFLNDLESNVSKTQSVIEKVGKANTLLGKSNNGNSVELDADQLKEYADALEYVNGAFQLNYEKVKQLNQEKVDEQINANVEAMKKAQEQLLINNQQISNMQSELSGLNAAQSQRKQDLEDSISKLQDENSGIETTIKEYQYLCVALGEASSAYQRWLDMQNGPSAGDFSSQTTTAFKQIQQVVKSKNGWGTSDFLYIRLYNTN